MVDWKAYLESICEKYAQWWDTYTLTNVVGNKYDQKVRKSLLLDLQAMVKDPPSAIAVKPETIKPEREEFLEGSKEREVFNVLEGLRKYAPEHVLLTGRPGSGKSSALVRLLLESAQNHLEIYFQANSESRLKTTESSTGSQFQLTSAMRQGIDSLTDLGENKQIPILVELRYYTTSILDLIRDFLKRHQLWLEISEIEKLLFGGQLLLLVDGVNELPSPEAQRNLQKFRQDYQQNTPMVFTTRDLGVGGDLGISKKLEMQPLTETQMRDFVRGYLPETGEQMLQQLGGRLREFGETPLLLMMLCSVFASNENQIPPNLRSVFRRFTEIYDGQLKQDIPVTDESRRWWKRLLQHLAWVMMGGCRDTVYLVSAPTEFLVAIPRQQAEEIFTEYLEGKVNCAADRAITWLNDLLKHHLIQIGAENKIEFRHQLIQEYYAAERFLQEVGKLSDDELKWDYLNYLKWTEPAALMLGLDVETQNFESSQALRVVRLALQLDWQLGARLAGEVKLEWQKQTVGLVESLNIPLLLKIGLLGQIKSEAVIPGLIKLLEDEDSFVRNSAASALGEIKSEAVIPALIKLLEDEDLSVRYTAASALGEIRAEAAISRLIKFMEHNNSSVRDSAAYALAKIKSDAVINGLFELIDNQDYYMRARTAITLGKAKLEISVPVLIKLLKDNESYVRYNAAYSLGQLKLYVATPELVKLLEDTEPDVRYVSANALGKMKSDVATPELIKLLRDEELFVRNTAASALREIKSEATMISLVKILNNQKFLQTNKGKYTLIALDTLEQIQEHFKYYKPAPIRTMSNILSHNYALLIGVGECAYPDWSLPVTVKDIQSLKTLLTDQNLCSYIDNDQHLRLLHDKTATSQNILDGLNWLKQQAENDPKATIFIYYSGHGWLDESTNKYYLIPHDTKPLKLTKTAIPAETFNAILQQIPAKQLLVIIDSCHAQGMASSKDEPEESELPDNFVETALPKNIIDELKQGTGRVVFTSSTGNQKSWIRPDGKMSVYTYHLLEALQGAANQAGDKVVRVSHLMNYLGKTIPESARDLCKAEQTPFFDFATEDFAIALLHGGKGLATEGWDKQKADEKIRGISNQVNNGVGIVGDNSGFIVGTAGDIHYHGK